MTSSWNTVRLGDLLALVRRKISTEVAEEYMLVTLPLYGKGARLRKTVSGAELGTAKYQVHTGDLMISKIDARKGSNSILPAELNGAVVTGDFLSYEVNTKVAEIEFMDLVAKSTWFAALCDSVSSGTTNRVRLDVRRFLDLSISLPPLAEQRRMVDLIGALDDAIEAGSELSIALQGSRFRVLEGLFAQHQETTIGSLLQGISGGKSPGAEGRPPGEGEFGVLKVSALDRLGFRPMESKTIFDISVFTDSMRVRKGDVLISRANTSELVGATCLVDDDYDHLFLCDKTLRLVPAEDVDSACLVAALNTTECRNQIRLAGTGTSASMKNISQPSIKNLRVKFPTTQRSQELIGEIDRALLLTIDAAVERTDSLRKVRFELLTSLLTGAQTIPESYDKAMVAEPEKVDA